MCYEEMKRSLLLSKEKIKGVATKIAAGVMAVVLGLSAGAVSCPELKEVQAAISYENLALNNTFVAGYVAENTPNFYSLSMPKDGWLTITFQGWDVEESCFELYNADMSKRYYSDSVYTSSATNPITHSGTRLLEKGTYIVKVSGLYSHKGSYHIKGSYQPSGNNETEPNNDFSNAMPLAKNKFVTGIISEDDNVDFYKIVLPKSMTVRVVYVARVSDSFYSVWDSEYIQKHHKEVWLGVSEDTPKTETVDIYLNAGVNYLKVDKYSSVTGRYQIKWQETPTPVSSVTIKGKTSGRVGNTISLKANVLPATATNKKVKWISYDTSIATVNSSGVVKLKKEGTVTIKAEAADGSGASGTFVITVKKAIRKVTKITISGEKTLKVGSSIKLKATVAPGNATNKKVKWTTTSKSIATVSSAGKVTAKKAGKVTIIATAADGSGVSGKYDLVIKKKNADFDASKSVKKISSVKLKATGNKKVKVTWKKQSAANKYEIQVATNKKFSSNLLVQNTAKGKDYISIRYKKTGTVYIRVRAIDKYGYVGKWSDTKSVKIK